MSDTYSLGCADCKVTTDSLGQKNLGGDAYLYDDAMSDAPLQKFLFEHQDHSLIFATDEFLSATDFVQPEEC